MTPSPATNLSIEAARGRDADAPGEIPQVGWRDVALRLRRRFAEDRLPLIAAGVAFYALLAAFPAIAALLALYGLLVAPREVNAQIAQLASLLPHDGAALLLEPLKDLARVGRASLGVGAAGGLLLALWSASAGIRTLIEALNVAYGEKEKRGLLPRIGLALLFTFGALAGALTGLAGVLVLPLALRAAGLDPLLHGAIGYARWPLLAILFWLALLVAYRYGPSRAHARWNWVSWGAMAAALLWLGGSLLFSLYAEHFGHYNKVYGSLGAVVVLLLWLLLSAHAVLLGALLNAELERQTRRDTTDGARKPLGQRGAHAADTVGEAPAVRET
jgi:membrane protein